jgi:hypothetical protein
VFVLPMIVQGMAMGLFFVALFAVRLVGLPPERVPAACDPGNSI